MQQIAKTISKILFNFLSMDVLKPGQIGGNCLLHKARLDENMQYVAPLQSWAPELRNFVELSPDHLSDCDVLMDKPTFLKPRAAFSCNRLSPQIAPIQVKQSSLRGTGQPPGRSL